MCLLCAAGPDRQGALAHRARVMQLLSLLEHPDALPAREALRLGQEIIALTGREPPVFRCEAMPSPGPSLTPPDQRSMP